MKKPLILAVDDAPDLLALIARALSDEYEVRTATSGAQALLAAAGDPQPVLILLDVEMEGITGFDACKALKTNPATASIPVIFITGKGEKQSEMQGFTLGAVDYVAKPINAAILKLRVATRVALASRRIALYAKLLVQAAGARPAACEMIEKAAPMHDIGKIAVPAEILRRSGTLSAPDWERVKRHPEYGVAIVDAFEAMTTTQFYREPLSIEQAAQEILRCAGTRYDPKLTEAFKKALPPMRKVRAAISDELGDIINLDFSAPVKAAAPAKPARRRSPRKRRRARLPEFFPHWVFTQRRGIRQPSRKPSRHARLPGVFNSSLIATWSLLRNA